MATKSQNPVIPDISTLPDVASRVDYITDLMEELDWATGKTDKLLAKAWGLSVSSIHGYSAEASRRITADADTARRDITASMRKLLREATKSGRAKDAAIVAKQWADVSGANAPTRQDIAVIGDITPTDARQKMATLFGNDVGKGKSNSPATLLEADSNETEIELEPATESRVLSVEPDSE